MSSRNWIKGEHIRYINGHGNSSPSEKRFWSKVDKTDNCWNWTAAKIKGYGTFGIDGKNYRAHRYSYELANGPIPTGMHVLHHCDNPRCVRGSHLFLGTDKDNMADASNKGRVAKGEKHGMAKLTEEDVKQIRIDYANGITGVSLAEKYSVSKSLISFVILRKRWQHVD